MSFINEPLKSLFQNKYLLMNPYLKFIFCFIKPFNRHNDHLKEGSQWIISTKIKLKSHTISFHLKLDRERKGIYLSCNYPIQDTAGDIFRLYFLASFSIFFLSQAFCFCLYCASPYSVYCFP